MGEFNMLYISIFFIVVLVACLIKLILDPNRIKPMSNEQIRHERIIRGMSSKF